jgi:formate-dependent nitrite reductase membrane component NrfD
MLSRHDTTVRAPEQGTRPHVFYKGVDAAALDPLRTRIAADGMIWADTTKDHPTLPVDPPGHGEHTIARTAYTTAHAMAWKGRVSAYLVTKALAAGAIGAAALGVLTGHAEERGFVGLLLPALGLLFAAVTGLLLIADLKQPKRFYYIFTKPQWRSWVVRGAFILAGFGALGTLWVLGGLADSAGLVKAVAVPAVALAAATAGYTAFLFGQCEGRDFWQTPLLLPTLLAQAGVGGGALALLTAPLFDLPDSLETAMRWLLLGSLAALGALLFTEHVARGTVHVEVAKKAMTHGEYRSRYLVGVGIGVALAGALAIVAVVAESVPAGIAAAIAAIAGLIAYEDAFVRAGQSVPLS